MTNLSDLNAVDLSKAAAVVKPAPLELRLYGDPGLRRESEPIREVTDAIRELAARMIVTMQGEETRGIGLAAPQVGVNIRLITVATVSDPFQLPPNPSPGQVLLCPRMPVALVNPEIVWCSKEAMICSEGCLSIPEVFEEVTRPVSVMFRATTLDGELLAAECGGLLARCLLHEIDHLDGVLFVDRIADAAARAAAPALRSLEKETRKRLGKAGKRR